jgi:hypothetical protein
MDVAEGGTEVDVGVGAGVRVEAAMLVIVGGKTVPGRQATRDSIRKKGMDLSFIL